MQVMFDQDHTALDAGAHDDDFLRRVLGEAELPALIPALACALGDLSLIDRAPRPPLPKEDVTLPRQGGMTDEEQVRAREVALEGLRRLLDGGAVERGPSATELRRLVEFITGPVSDDYLSLIHTELGILPRQGEPNWRKDQIAPERAFRVAVIGAGMSGLAAAYRLQQAGVDFRVFERNADVGGTWLVNDYPGCRLDTSNFAYSYSFAQRQDWPQQFSKGSEIHKYFSSFADDAGLRSNIEFNVSVVAASWDESRCIWTLELQDSDGTRTVEADVVISAVGQLNLPNVPQVPGRERFTGSAFHTAQWRDNVDLAGARVAVVGTGASAFQVIPAIVDEVGSMTIFQRNPPWMLPTPEYHNDLPAGLSWLLEHVPDYHRWYRFYQFWVTLELRRHVAEVDPDWQHPVSVSESNERLRSMLVAHLTEQFADRPDLLEKVIPSYPPYSKRMLRDNGVWSEALHRDNVELVTSGVAEITETAIRTEDGEAREFDVIIWGTGFRASEFLNSVDVVGQDGVSLREFWDGDAKAYYGLAVPGFPNLFCLYGPNTNLALNGSIITMTEAGVESVLGVIGEMLATGARAVEVRPEAYAGYNDAVDEVNAKMAWGAPNVTSWFKNARGRVSQNWPHRIVDYWNGTHSDPSACYEFRR